MTNTYHLVALAAQAAVRAPGFMEAIEKEAKPFFAGSQSHRLMGYEMDRALMKSLAARFPLLPKFSPQASADARLAARAAMRDRPASEVAKLKKLAPEIRSKWLTRKEWAQQLLGEKPCAFEGCEERRDALEKELATLAADCSDCEQNAIKGRHLRSLYEHFDKSH